MRAFIQKEKSLSTYLLVWTLINVLQSIFLNITPDEAYYWVWSKQLAWGYLDHPPMVAWLIKPGYALIRHELGVRLIFTIISTLSLLVLHHLTAPIHFAAFFWLSLACLPLQLAGFHALPDVPLIFFSLLFLFSLKKYLNKDSLGLGLLLGFLVAGMLYSKYHSILILLPVIFAIPSLFCRKSFWLALLFAIALMLPHLIWQYQHGFASLEFHLRERSWWHEPYKLINTLKYLILQPIIIGPLMGFLMIFALVKTKIENAFQRLLVFQIAFVYLFFFLITFNGGPVHRHWTIPALPAILFLSIKFFDNHFERFKKILTYTGGFSLITFLLARSFLIYDYLPETIQHDPNHGWEAWAKEIEAQAGGRPVVFISSFGDAARFEFYSNIQVTSISNIYDRRSQFDLWERQKDFIGKEVLMISQDPSWIYGKTDSFYTSKGLKYYSSIADNFAAYPLIEIQTEARNYRVKQNEKISIPIKVSNRFYSEEALSINAEAIPKLGYQIFKHGATVIEIRTDQKIEDIQGREIDIDMLLPELPGKYKVKFCVYTSQCPPTQNSRIINLSVD